MAKVKRYAITTHDDSYPVERVELDGYSYVVATGKVYDEIVATTRGRAKAIFIENHRSSHVEFTDRMSIRLMTECECGGSVWDCPKCGGNKWYVQEKAK